jgi:hydrogenase-4 component F
MPHLLVLVPLLAALLAALLPWPAVRKALLLAVALFHFSLSLGAFLCPEPILSGAWLGLDAPGRLVLLVVSSVFMACALYAMGYLELERLRPERVLVACLLAFLGIASLLASARHLGLLWVSMEAATLSTAPMIYYNRNPRSLEATWKYLLIGSVGIALALLGTYFLAYASLFSGKESSLFFDKLLLAAPTMSRPWLRSAFIFLLVGYGTKMGLSPMHTWKPDAYGEAPGLVGALLAGALTSCAFLALYRVQQICYAAGEQAFTQSLFIFMGLLSMVFGAAGMFGQRDLKRLLAYSSVEHMGILSLGLGLGGPGVFAAFLHLLNNALTKGVLFLSAGNIQRAYGSKSLDRVRGVLRRLPLSGALFLLGFFAITGSPPFAPFISEFSIMSAALGGRHYWAAAAYLALLLIAFIGMGGAVLSMVLGKPPAGRPGGAEAAALHEGWAMSLPILALMAAVLALGLWMPDALRTTLQDCAKILEAHP